MQQNEFRKGIEKLELAYNQKFTNEKLLVWWDKLKGMNGEKFLQRIDELIPQKKFMPNIAEILNKKEKLTEFEQRDYSNYDFNKLLAHRDIIEGE